VPSSDDELLSECEMQVLRTAHAGESCAVRLIHRPTGLIVGVDSEPSTTGNRDVALARLKALLSE
jgi:protein subunit release factor A